MNDAKTMHALEFHVIRDILAEHTSFSGGKRFALQLQPSSNPIWIADGLRETQEAVSLLDEGYDPPFGGLHDIREHITQASRGSLLHPPQLLEIVDTLQHSERLAKFIRQHTKEEHIVFDIAADISIPQSLCTAIRRCITEEGQVADSASEQLRTIRAGIRGTERKIRTELERIMRTLAERQYVQDTVITVRSGRYVIPVKQQYRMSVPGIVHDQSASGATVYVEPERIVALGNDLRSWQSKEEKEVQRILRELTVYVGKHADDLEQTVHAVSHLDFVFAKARLAIKWNCSQPRMTEERFIYLKQARHPLLDEKTVVPIDVRFGKNNPILVITGPNTGGKTVTLKTVGLLIMMAQAGLHIPAAPGCELPRVDNVFVDIGDEQSIEQSLSTFSSHMKNIVRIVTQAGPNSLVLLDELGAGTDPTEGAVLAMALLEHFLSIPCLTIATTHYSELKSFAYTEPGVQNASVEFNVETLQPTYRLSIGVAGSSNAFAICKRLGLMPSIIERAKQRLTVEEQKVEELLRHVETDRRRAAEERKRVESLRKQLTQQQEELAEQQAHFKARRQAILDEARKEAAELVRQARLQTEQLIGMLRKQGAHTSVQDAQAARQALQKSEQRIAQYERDDMAMVQPSNSVQAGPNIHDMQVGTAVRVNKLNKEGEIVSAPDAGGHITVQIGMLRTQVHYTEVTLVKQQGRRSEPRSRGQGTTPEAVMRGKSMTISSELDLRGLTSEEAIERVERYIDSALLANIPSARIIHGKGTGVLRKVIQSYLRENPHVKSFRLGEHGEGGSGVTVVQF